VGLLRRRPVSRITAADGRTGVPLILVGRCSPKPKAATFPYAGPLGFAPPLADVWAEWDPSQPLGCRFDGHMAPEDAIALGATPVVWFPRTLAGNGGKLPTDDQVRGLAQSFDQRFRGVLGQPLLFILRFVEWNTWTYLPASQQGEIAALAQHYIDLMRETLPPDRMIVSWDVYPTPTQSAAKLLAMVPHGAQLCGLDLYQIGQLDPTTPEGAAAHGFAVGCGRPVATFECGIFPRSKAGDPPSDPVLHAKLLLKWWLDHKVMLACICSADFTGKVGMDWGDGTLEHMPAALAVLKDGLVKLGAVHGPLQFGGASEAAAKLTGTAVAA